MILKSTKIFKKLKLILLVLASFHALYGQDLKGKKVLLINSYHPQYTWTNEFTKAVANVLNEHLDEDDLSIEYLDGRHMSNNSSYSNALVSFYKEKYSQKKFDILLSSDDYALDFLMTYKKEIFGNTPLVFGGINDLGKLNLINHQEYTGVFEGLPVIENLNLIATTNKNIKTIYLISDLTKQGEEIKNTAKEKIKKWNNKDINLVFEDNFSFEELVSKSEKMNQTMAFLILAYHKDNNGNYFSYDRDLPVWSKKSKAPIYGMCGNLLIGKGALGGYMNSPYTHGEEIATIAIDILKGKKIEDTEIKLETIYKPVFDYNGIIKFNLSLDDLPKNTTVFYKPKTFYEKHRKVINIGLIVFLFLMLTILFLAKVVRNQRKYNAKLRHYTNELQIKNNHLHHFSYITSHQLRSNSVNMKLLLNYYNDDELDDNQKEWTLEKISKSTTKIEDTVEDIAKILSLQELKPIAALKSIELLSFLNSFVKTYSERTLDGVLKFIFLGDHKAFILSDLDVLTQIVTILVENSIKFNPLANNPLLITFKIKIKNKEVSLTIHDNGDGLPDSYKNKIFNVYQRGHNEIEGKGLGLYLSKLLSLTVHSTINYLQTDEKGTTFEIIFPKV